MYVEYFKKNNEYDLVYCSDIDGLLSKMGIRTNMKDDWWMFIDGSVQSIKAVLLHRDNKFPAIPIAYSRKAKESYETLRCILNLVRYEEFLWKICADLKVTGILTGMQGGYTKFPCFLCLWDSRDREHHYNKDEWPLRNTRAPGEKNIKYEPLVPAQKIVLPPLHVKLGIFKNFVKSLKKDGEPVKILTEIFPRLSKAKLAEGVFVGPDLRKVNAFRIPCLHQNFELGKPLKEPWKIS